MPTAAELAAGGVPQEDHDPFGVLRNANTVLLHNLRRDENLPELQKQLTSTGLASTSKAYFCDPYTNSYLGPQVRKTRSNIPTAFFEFGLETTNQHHLQQCGRKRSCTGQRKALGTAACGCIVQAASPMVLLSTATLLSEAGPLSERGCSSRGF